MLILLIDVKKTKLKCKSKSPLKKFTDLADRALQDWYRKHYPDEKCESCGKQFELMHHFYEKSQSARLRFEHKNLIFLCHGCHFRHHRTGDQDIMSRVIVNRGTRWLKNLRKLKLEPSQMTLQVAQKMIEKYGD